MLPMTRMHGNYNVFDGVPVYVCYCMKFTPEQGLDDTHSCCGIQPSGQTYPSPLPASPFLIDVLDPLVTWRNNTGCQAPMGSTIYLSADQEARVFSESSRVHPIRL